MENRFVTIVSPEKISETAKELKADFVTTKEFVTLVLGAGVHGQNKLNELAWKESGYYRDFCTQRLAHDLLGCLLLNIENNRQLYFCFKNIQDFLLGFRIESPGWNEISTWLDPHPFPLKHEEILEKSLRNLELLATIR
jgi:hypothetical protein